MKYPNITRSVLKDAAGKTVKYQSVGKDQISFRTKVGQIYTITEIPPHRTLAAPQELKAYFNKNTVCLQWEPVKDAITYTIFRNHDNNPGYELVATDIKQPIYEYTAPELKDTDYLIFKVVPFDREGNEGKAKTICVEKNNE